MSKKSRQKTNWIKNIVHSLMYSFLIMIALGLLLGYRPILVNGGSAEPFIHYRSLIITSKCAEEDLKIGDFVTFSVSGKIYTTHQIVSINDDGTITCRGWNYNRELGEYTYQTDTQTITYKNIVGKVVWTSYVLGNTVFVLRDNKIVLVALVGIALLAILVKDNIKTKSEFAEQ